MFLSGCCNINQRFVSASFITEAQTVIINLVIAVCHFTFVSKKCHKTLNMVCCHLARENGWISLSYHSGPYCALASVPTDFSKTESIPWYAANSQSLMQTLLSLLWLISVDTYQDISPPTTLNTYLNAELTRRSRFNITCAKRDLSPTCFYFNYLLFTDCVNNIEKLTFAFKGKECLQSWGILFFSLKNSLTIIFWNYYNVLHKY